jgi:hypothetical protein
MPTPKNVQQKKPPHPGVLFAFRQAVIVDHVPEHPDPKGSAQDQHTQEPYQLRQRERPMQGDIARSF